MFPNGRRMQHKQKMMSFWLYIAVPETWFETPLTCIHLPIRKKSSFSTTNGKKEKGEKHEKPEKHEKGDYQHLGVTPKHWLTRKSWSFLVEKFITHFCGFFLSQKRLFQPVNSVRSTCSLVAIHSCLYFVIIITLFYNFLANQPSYYCWLAMLYL